MNQSKLHQIVREMLKRWRRRALKKAHSFSDPSVCNTDMDAGRVQTRRAISMPNIRDGGSSSSTRGGSTMAKVPAGHLAVYVGQERRRFVIKMSCLSHPLFKALLKKTEEEIGFQSEGGLALACEVAPFEQLLQIIQSSCKAHQRQSSMAEDCSPAEEKQYERLLQQLLESADLDLSRKKAHPRCDLRRPLCQAMVA